tara:strand:+ start:5676 stop:6347 length:672 start_codon:yes stop_codon:yes gene_type:complete
MPKLYASFEDLVQSHDALFKPHRQTGALNVCRGVWDAREPELQSLKEQLSSLKSEFDRLSRAKDQLSESLNAKISSLEQELGTTKGALASTKRERDATRAKLNETEVALEATTRDLARLQKYEDSLDMVQRSQFREIEAQKKRYQAESTLRAELEVALNQQTKTNELHQLEIMSKDDLITRLQARIEDLESRGKQQQRLNARMGVELDRFARENDQLSRAINQ